MFLTQSGGFIIKPISRLLGAILSLLYRGLNAIGVESIGIAIILFYADRTFDHIPVDV
ncbi:MAG: hypothetical protein ACLUGQ_01455 [Coprococcus sp.]